MRNTMNYLKYKGFIALFTYFILSASLAQAGKQVAEM